MAKAKRSYGSGDIISTCKIEKMKQQLNNQVIEIYEKQ